MKPNHRHMSNNIRLVLDFIGCTDLRNDYSNILFLDFCNKFDNQTYIYTRDFGEIWLRALNVCSS